MINIIASEQAEWSQRVFGSDADRGPIGPLKHLQKEAQEAIDSPGDVYEYADCLLLVMDASRRAGFPIQTLLDAAYVKLQICKDRVYPAPGLDQPAQHIKGS